MNVEKIRQWIGFIIEALIFIVIIACTYSCLSRKQDASEQNLKAALGRIEVVELENGELLSSRDSYIATINDLEDLLDISKKEIKDIQRHLDDKIAYISNIESNVRVEYIETVRDSIVYVNPSTATSSFSYFDKWVTLNGVNEFRFGEKFDYSTTITSISMDVPLNVGLTNDYKIFVKSSNPYVHFSDIQGAVIDNSIMRPRKKRFSWGLQGGFGLMYDVIDKDIAAGPYLGIGAEFNF